MSLAAPCRLERERERERERESLFATKIKNIQNYSKYITVTGYQTGKPIKLVAFSTDYIKYYRMQRNKTEHECKWVCTVQRKANACWERGFQPTLRVARSLCDS